MIQFPCNITILRLVLCDLKDNIIMNFVHISDLVLILKV